MCASQSRSSSSWSDERIRAAAALVNGTVVNSNAKSQLTNDKKHNDHDGEIAGNNFTMDKNNGLPILTSLTDASIKSVSEDQLHSHFVSVPLTAIEENDDDESEQRNTFDRDRDKTDATRSSININQPYSDGSQSDNMSCSEHSFSDVDHRSASITCAESSFNASAMTAPGKYVRKPPTAVQDEMQRKGFKKWSRRHQPEPEPNLHSEPVRHKPSVAGWDRKGIPRSDHGIVMSSYRRRSSTAFGGDRGSRRGSAMKVLFGEVGSRRFSQDLRKPEPDDELEPHHHDDETAKVIFFQVFIPFLIAGFGNVGAGIILDYVQHWDVFKTVTDLFILVASFLGFKGNLEMTLAARLATQANIGKLDDPKSQWSVAVGNIALIQGQAIMVPFLAALIAIGVNYFKEFQFDSSSTLLLFATSLCTASITGLFLAALIVVITILARRAGVNPDNVSTLIAAFLGDISAVALLSGSAKFFFDYRHLTWLAPAVIGFFLLVLPVALIIARRNEFTHDVVGMGWFPIIISMIISSAGGFIFDFAVGIFETIAVFQPIINGVGSNLVAVQASRISTYFHQRCEMGSLPAEDGEKYRICQTPFGAFFGNNPNVRTARLLLLMSIPGHLMYIVTIRLVKSGDVLITLPFLVFYLLVAITQVIILLYLAHLIVPFLWKKKIDPDNAAIPGIMATGDLIGTLFLTVAYFILQMFNDPNVSRHSLPD